MFLLHAYWQICCGSLLSKQKYTCLQWKASIFGLDTPLYIYIETHTSGVKKSTSPTPGASNFHIWAGWNNQLYARWASKKIYRIWTNLSMTTFPCFRSLPSHCLVSLSLNKCVMRVRAILLVSECIKITFILTLIINR